MKDIDAHQHAVMLEHSLEDCWNLSVGDQLPRGADRLIEPTVTASLNSARKKPAGEQSHLAPLLHDRLIGSTRLRCEFRLMYLPVETFEALHTSHEFAF
jgi:hypothetical protein